MHALKHVIVLPQTQLGVPMLCCQLCCGKLLCSPMHRWQQSGHQDRQASRQPAPADAENRDRRAGYALLAALHPCVPYIPCGDCHQWCNVLDGLIAPCRRRHLAAASQAFTAERRHTVVACVPCAQPDGNAARDPSSQCSAGHGTSAEWGAAMGCADVHGVGGTHSKP